MRFELTTLTLARLCSTPELRPHSVSVGVMYKGSGPAARAKMQRQSEFSASISQRPDLRESTGDHVAFAFCLSWA